ncbi:MAG: hypothetical protein ABIF87_14260 [Pseudomonadota bacterium]
MKYKKEDYHKIVKLFLKQNWLIPKKTEFTNLLKLSRKKDAKEMIFSLLERFHYLNDSTFHYLLNEIADSIIGCGFGIETTQLLSITYDDKADSSQKILDMIRIPLFKKGWRSIKTVNHYRSSVKNYKNGKNQIITIDEFIGSGKTLLGRIKQ